MELEVIFMKFIDTLFFLSDYVSTINAFDYLLS